MKDVIALLSANLPAILTLLGTFGGIFITGWLASSRERMRLDVERLYEFHDARSDLYKSFVQRLVEMRRTYESLYSGRGLEAIERIAADNRVDELAVELRVIASKIGLERGYSMFGMCTGAIASIYSSDELKFAEMERMLLKAMRDDLVVIASARNRAEYERTNGNW